MDQVEEIKSKLDIVDVIRDYTPLKAAGVNFKANCPFHREKTPSFVVSPEKQIWHCFGCAKGGDVFSFVTEIEGIGFGEALRILAPKAGVVLKKQNPQEASERGRLYDILELSQNYYYRALENEKNTPIGAYIKKRGLDEDTISEWQIGYSRNSWDDVYNGLKKKGFSDEDIFKAGMSVKKKNGSGYFNRFKDRIMFPINDVNGNIVAFTARINPEVEKKDDFQGGKYINSPQTAIYDKSRIVFGLDKAKKEIKNQDFVIVVEGQMDVVTAHKHGYENVVATSGTALTREQVMLLKRYTNNVALAFDMDSAGQMAADRGIREAMQAEMNIKIILIPSGKDPDECIRNSESEWKDAVKQAKPMMDYFLEVNAEELDFDKGEDRQKYRVKCFSIVVDIKSASEQGIWLKHVASRIGANEMDLRSDFDEFLNNYKPINRKQNIRPEPVKVKVKISRDEKMSEFLIALILKFPKFLNYAINHVELDQITGIDNKWFYKNLIIYYNTITNSGQEIKIEYNEFKGWLTKENPDIDDKIKVFDRLILLGDRDFYDFDDVQVKAEIINTAKFLKKDYLSHRMKEIEKLVAMAEKEENNTEIRSLMEELNNLSKELRDIG